MCSRQLLRCQSFVATHGERRPGTLGKISGLVVLQIINETTVVALTSGMENEDNGKTEANLDDKVRDESAVRADEDDNKTLFHRGP